MTAAELYQRIIAYGADEAGIRDRFGDDAELYQACFLDFLEERNFALLASAMDARDLPRAFDAAHALKGLSGNLGVTAFYGAIHTLVEALRENRGEDADTAYAEVLRQRDRLACVLSDTQPLSAELPAPKTADAADTPAREAEKNPDTRLRDSFLLKSAVLILAAITAIGFLFARIRIQYRENVLQESGQHLIEMSNQIRLYVEEQIDNDWKVAESIGDSIVENNYIDDDADILHLLARKQAIWNVSSLMLYTESGYCVDAGGNTESNDIASELIVKARENGRHLSIVESKIIYTVPVETQLRYNGARIAAVSVVQDMASFLDDMHFSSFDEQAWMYLADDAGVVISRLTNDNAVPAFNFRAVARDMTVTPLNAADAPESLYTAPASAAFLLSDDSARNYAVSAPIATGAAPLRLFYLATEAAVNSTMNNFSQQLTSFSMAIIFLFAALAFLLFIYLYQTRKKRFDTAIVARDRMFDLLVKNTRTSFALFTANAEKPDYISSNCADVVGDRYWALDKDETGYRLRNDAGAETETLERANEMLSGWDGKSVFHSGYIKNDATVPPCYFDYQLYPIGDGDEQFVGIAQDVTTAYAREEATKAAMELAKRANEAKSRFLSNMSHDIRTPMNAIMNMADFAQECIDQPKKLGPYLHTIRESSEHLLLLINEVLDMNRIESGQTLIASEPFDLVKTLARQVDIVRPLCDNKQQTLITDFSGLTETTVLGDALKLSQIITNLLSNAVKFTPEKGAVRFTAETLLSLSSDIADVRFTIEDTGIGMDSHTLNRVFEPFYRADDKRVGKIEGTGLGLSICKSYVEAMGGTIRCESEEGEGSTFIVELFFQEASSEPITRADATALTGTPFIGMHCLVVEDNATNQAIAKTLLSRVGFIVDFADNGLEGVEKFLRSKPHTYDVIYMDIRMPIMDGYEAALAIRHGNHPEANTVPIIAMTANVYAEDIEKARVAGMDGYLGKPIVSFDLIEQTDKALHRKRGDAK